MNQEINAYTLMQNYTEYNVIQCNKHSINKLKDVVTASTKPPYYATCLRYCIIYMYMYAGNFKFCDTHVHACVC